VPAPYPVIRALRTPSVPAFAELLPHKAATVATLASAAAWALLVGRTHTPDWAALCTSTSATGWDRLEEVVAVAWRLGAVQTAAQAWALMCLAMGPVLALPKLRFVAARSYASRRARAVGGFLAGSLAVWLLAGAGVLPILLLGGALPQAGHATVLASAFVLAALWQLTPAKRSALRRCHRTAALAASGWRADRDCIRFGIDSSFHCVASCWAMMLACMFASHSLATLLLVQGIAMHERAVHAPRLSLYALLLGACAAAAALGPALLA
jgi:predicted metal-binding membrane protein